MVVGAGGGVFERTGLVAVSLDNFRQLPGQAWSAWSVVAVPLLGAGELSC